MTDPVVFDMAENAVETPAAGASGPFSLSTLSDAMRAMRSAYRSAFRGSAANVVANVVSGAQVQVQYQPAAGSLPDTFGSMAGSPINMGPFTSALTGLEYGSGASLGSGPLYQFGYSAGADAALAEPAFVRQFVPEPSRAMLKRVAIEVEEADLVGEDQKLATEAEAVLGYMPLRVAMRLPGTLRRVLAKLEIEVLEEASVDAYKAQMAAHYETAGKMPMPTWRLSPLEHYTQEVPTFVLRKAIEIKRELPAAKFYIDQLAIDPFLLVSLTDQPDWMHNRSRTLDPEMAAYIEVWLEPKFEAEM